MEGMEVSNGKIADQLHLMAQLLEILEENPFKIRAYIRAAEVIGRLATPVAALSPKDLETIAGIGPAIAEKVHEIAANGTFPELEEARGRVPPGLIEMLTLEGVGPKTARVLWKKLHIETLDDLEKAARGHRIRTLKGFGEKKERGFLKAIAIARQRKEERRMTRLEADLVIEEVKRVMREGTYDVAGSYRRGKSTIGDIDIVSVDTPSTLNRRLTQIADEVLDEGERKTSFRCRGSRVDIRYTTRSTLGTMLLYLTGSKAFNIRLREIALQKGWRLNEYGIRDLTLGTVHEFSREAEIFSFLGMDPIVPELREDWGEIDAALSHNLPNLVERSQIRSDLHVHSSWSDGNLDIPALAKAGEAHGYTHLLCTDHSSSLGIARGLDEPALRRQAHEIEISNRDSSCQILHGVEVDILADGTTGLPSRILKDLDVVIGSVHSAFSQEIDVMTRRVLSAIGNEHIDIIGHPTGRLLGQREAYAIDMPRVIAAAAEAGKALECNASPFRMDIDDLHIREAVTKGVPISIGTDSHGPGDLAWMDYGVKLCRRGWAEPGNILNTMSVDGLREWAS
ncbi:MAG TPA: DNA polymerase/3'-5' exonuclease PolX [Methanolinea sp.]|nr:DNA polymerase/3'-5' exonuclease PolX [Methanolinea sp.]HQK55328.1 DNA polymerase/3'-5' exonuclease PolX [Methanolinea sp.]